MSRHTIHPNINASLLRELRIIAQSLFVTRTLNNSRERRMPSLKSTTFKCVPCMRDNPRTVKDAVVIEDGYSVCPEHIRA